jgi:hypothetical protein
MNRSETLHAVAKLLQEHQRPDYYLQATDDGEYFLAEGRDVLGPDGRYIEPAVEVPRLPTGLGLKELEGAAEGLINDLDQLWLEHRQLQEDEAE